MKKKELLVLLSVLSFLIILPAKDLSNVSKVSFYASFFSFMCILSLYCKMKQDTELASFYVGVIAVFVVLCSLQAIPFIEGWTRHGSLLQEIFRTPFPLHHSLLALLFSPIMILAFVFRNRIPARLQFLVYVLIGADLFSFVSQVPEIMFYGTFFWD